MRCATKAIVGVIIIFVVCELPCARAAVLPKTAKLVPPETLLLVDVEDFSRLKAQFEKTNLYKLYKDPAMAAFVENFKAKWREKVRELDNKILEAIVDAEVLPQGRVAMALVLDEPGKEADEPLVLFISQWGETIDKIKEAVGKMAQKVIEDGAHRRTEDYRGVDIITLIKELPPVQVPDYSSYTPEQQGAPPMKTVYRQPTKTSYCFIDDCLIGSMNLETLKFVIAHIKGAGSATLADDTDYAAVIATVGPYHDIDVYVNIKQVIKMAVAEDTTGGAQSTMANLGLDNVAAAGCSIGLARGAGSSCRGKASLRINGAKKGICKMLEVESAVLKAPRFVSESAYSVAFLNLNVKKAYKELHDILYKFDPMSAAGMYAPLLPPGPDGQPGLQLKTDVIDHLGSQIVFARGTTQPTSAAGAPAPPESLFALAVLNRRALEKSLSTLHSKLIARNNPDAVRELLGHTIYLIDLSGMLPGFLPGERIPMQAPAGPAVPQMPTFAFTITDTHLIFGTESSVERAIRTLSSTEAASVGSAKWFADARLTIPSVVGMAHLENNAASSEIFWQMIKETGKSKASSAAMGPGAGWMFPQGGLDSFSFELLPDFDVVRKYFGSSILYGISRGDGFFFEFNYLNPTSTD